MSHRTQDPLPTASLSEAESFRTRIQQVEAEIGKVIIGQDRMIEAIICTLLAQGHILLEGVPGLAKSLTVATFARTIGGTSNAFNSPPTSYPVILPAPPYSTRPAALLLSIRGRFSATFYWLMKSTVPHRKSSRRCLRPCRKNASASTATSTNCLNYSWCWRP